MFPSCGSAAVVCPKAAGENYLASLGSAMACSKASAKGLLKLIPDQINVMWYGKAVNAALCLLPAERVITVVASESEAGCVAKVRYHGKWTVPERLQYPGSAALGESEGSAKAAICLGCVARAEVQRSLEIAMQRPSVSVVALSVTGQVSTELDPALQPGWSLICKQMLWSTCTRFETGSQLLLCVRKPDYKDELAQCYREVYLEMKGRALESFPGLTFPFNPYAGMKVSAVELEHKRAGPEISYYVQKAKKQKTTSLLPAASMGETVFATGPWPDVRELLPQDFLHLYGYRAGVCNLHLLSPAEQKKIVCQSVPLPVAEHMYRLAVCVLTKLSS